MNKKIRELAEAAGYYHDFDNDGTIVFKNTPGDKGDLELFAKLIVKECAVFGMVVTDDHFDVDALYKHFGVE